MNKRKSLLGIGMILALMALTGYLLLKDLSLNKLAGILVQVKPGWLLLGLGLMVVFVGCEAMCSRLILGRLGHKPGYRRCLGYSFVGFYVSSITPSSTGGQPAQVYYMSRDNIPAAHGALNMMLIAVCYQVTVVCYALVVVLSHFRLVTNLGNGLMLLLLYGTLVNGALTAGMLCLMFLPNAARKLTGGVLRLLVRLHLVRKMCIRDSLHRDIVGGAGSGGDILILGGEYGGVAGGVKVHLQTGGLTDGPDRGVGGAVVGEQGDLLALLVLGGEHGTVDGDPDVVVHRDGAGGGQGGHTQTNRQRGDQNTSGETFTETLLHVKNSFAI